MKSQRTFWTSVLLLVVFGLGACAQTTAQQKGKAVSVQQQEEKEKDKD